MKRVDRLEVAHLNLVNSENMRGVVRESQRQDVRATIAPFTVTHNFGVRPSPPRIGDDDGYELCYTVLDFVTEAGPSGIVAPAVYATPIDRESWTETSATLRCTQDDVLVRIWFSARIEP